MRIMHVIAHFHAAGTEQVVTDLAVALRQRGHDCSVVALTTPSVPDAVGEQQKSRLAAAGVEIMEFPGERYRVNLLTGPLRLVALWRRWRPDLVHSHTDRPDFAVSLALRVLRVPVARTIHNSQLWHSHWWWGRIAEGGFRDDLVVFPSDATRQAYHELRLRYGLAGSRAQITIPFGVAQRQVAGQADRALLKHRFGADPDRLQLCYAGRFTPQKGFDILLSALERLPRAVLGRLELHAFGAGEQLEADMARALATQLPVRFHKPVAGLGRLLGAFDALVVPSRFEATALITLDGFSAGVPVLATRAPGLVEILPPGWPLAVSPEDPAALANCIAELASPNFAAGDLRERAWAWALDRFRLDSMVAAYDAAYQEFVSHRLPGMRALNSAAAPLGRSAQAGCRTLDHEPS